MPCQARTGAPLAEPATGGRARWRVEGGWRASCWSLDGGAWPSRPQDRGGRQWEGRRDRVAGADRRDSSKEQDRGRRGAPCTHNTHCTLKLSLVSGICSQRGAGGVGVGDCLQVSMEMIGRDGSEQVVGAKAGTALTAKLECPDGTRYYFDFQSNM